MKKSVARQEAAARKAAALRANLKRRKAAGRKLNQQEGARKPAEFSNKAED